MTYPSNISDVALIFLESQRSGLDLILSARQKSEMCALPIMASW